MMRAGYGTEDRESPARVIYSEEESEGGRVIQCVYAECIDGGGYVGPVWGAGDRSVRRALAELTEECDCGRKWHTVEEEVED